MKMLSLPLAAFAGLVLLMASCSAPAKQRIAENPGVFAKLDAHEQELVQSGKVARGMSKDAVLLAWGEPDQKTTEMLGSKSYEKWVYNGYVPTDGYYLETVRPGAPATTHFTGLLLIGDSSNGNTTTARVRDGYFDGDKLQAWDLAH